MDFNQIVNDFINKFKEEIIAKIKPNRLLNLVITKNILLNNYEKVEHILKQEINQ